VRTRNKAHMVAIVGLALSFAACVTVRVDRDVRRVDAYFDRAAKEISSLENADSAHRRRPHRLCVLVYDADEGTVVRVSLPLWLVNLGLDLGMRADADGHDFDARKRYDFEWKAVKDLDRYGRGLLVSVEEGEDRVLVWLR